MDYSLDDVDQFDTDFEFAQWLSNERFIRTEGMRCDFCNEETELQGKIQ